MMGCRQNRAASSRRLWHVAVYAALGWLISTNALAQSHSSLDGLQFIHSPSPVAIHQTNPVNTFIVIQEERLSEAAIIQAGQHNRAVVIQLGHDKQSVVQQHGPFNQLLVLQVAQSDQDIHRAHQEQHVPDAGEDISGASYAFLWQTLRGETATPLDQRLSTLTLQEAGAVAGNFVMAPQLNRVNLRLLENHATLLLSSLQLRLDQQRFAHTRCNAANEHTCKTAPWFMGLAYQYSDHQPVVGVAGFKQDLYTLYAGRQFSLADRLHLGFAVAYSESESDIRRLPGSMSMTGYQAAAFATILGERAYLDMIGGGGVYDIDGQRFSGLSSVNASLDGWGYLARLQGGYLLGEGAMRMGPFVAGTYTHSQTDGYQERGDLLLTQRMDKQNRAQFLGALGFSMDRQDHWNGRSLHSFLKAEVEQEFRVGSTRVSHTHFSFNPDDRLLTPFDDVAGQSYGRLSGGVNLALSKHSQVSLAAATLIDHPQVDRYQVQGQLNLSF